MINACSICQKIVAVSLYLRVKPIVRGVKISKDTHHFFGYWPPDSHLLEYIKHEYMAGPFLQQLYEKNCRGHTLEEITEAIEQKIPPMPGVPIKILWNPGSKVTPYLLAETPAQRAAARVELQQDLRTVIVDEKSEVKVKILWLLNNAAPKLPSVSRRGAAIKVIETPYAAQEWSPAGAKKRAEQIEAANQRIWDEFVGMNRRARRAAR